MLIAAAVGADVVVVTTVWRSGARPTSCAVDRALLSDEVIEELRDAFERIVLARDPDSRLQLSTGAGAGDGFTGAKPGNRGRKPRLRIER